MRAKAQKVFFLYSLGHLSKDLGITVDILEVGLGAAPFLFSKFLILFDSTFVNLPSSIVLSPTHGESH